MRIPILPWLAVGLSLALGPISSTFGQTQGRQGQGQSRQPGNYNRQGQQGQSRQPQNLGQQGQSRQQGQQGQSGQPQNLGQQGQSRQQGQSNQFSEVLSNPNPAGQPLRYWLSTDTMTPGQYAFFHTADRNSGMSLAAVDDALRTHLKLPKDEGLIVTSLDVHSPAALAGIQQNDVLLYLHGATLRKPEDLDEALKAAGDKPAVLVLLRHGQKRTIKVQPSVRVTLGPVQPEPPAFWIGIAVAPIEPALRAHLQLPQKQGLLAIDVVKDSPAAKAGVRPNDILLGLDGEALRDQAKLIELVQAKGEKTVPLEIIREGKEQTVEITPQRRAKPRLSVHWSYPDLRLDVVHPGAVLTAPRHERGIVKGDFNDDGVLDVFTVTDRASTSREKESSAATMKRLDDLAAQIKDLRQAIQELTKAAQEKK